MQVELHINALTPLYIFIVKSYTEYKKKKCKNCIKISCYSFLEPNRYRGFF